MPFPQPMLPKHIFFGFNAQVIEACAKSGKLLQSHYGKCQDQKAKALNRRGRRQSQVSL